jgi:uncharacterized protein YecE (DUF72 family)
MMQSTQYPVRIGTSGIVLPITKPQFPEEFQDRSRLHYYSSIFNTLEINSSFYKIPQAKTFSKWSHDVNENFRFSVKLWKGITHTKFLDYSEQDINLFLTSINPMQSKAGCILIQFPASIKIQYLSKIESILDRIKKIDQKWKLAIELRHQSWYCDQAYKIFQRYNASIVLHDMPGSATPFEYLGTHFIYRRFHGHEGKYAGGYSYEQLALYASQIQQWKKSIADIYIYFNNTLGKAFDNAQLLGRLIHKTTDH